jgi:hypothetical protein
MSAIYTRSFMQTSLPGVGQIENTMTTTGLPGAAE